MTVLDVTALAREQMRLARLLHDALMTQRALRIEQGIVTRPVFGAWGDERGRRLQAAANEVARLRLAHQAALDAYNEACDRAAGQLTAAPADDQPTLFGEGQ